MTRTRKPIAVDSAEPDMAAAYPNASLSGLTSRRIDRERALHNLVSHASVALRRTPFKWCLSHGHEPA